MRETIQAQLERIETDEGVRIVYACESGSRAWGFPSADSDWDVRFLYVRPVDWYLSIDEKRDVIERPISDALDISGWDLRKALRLFRKSNPPLMEWLGSPIVYRENSGVAARMREIAPTIYSPSASLYHYRHIAQGNFREYLQGPTVRTKKYFYVLRPLLAMKWIENGFGVAPTDFTVAVERLIVDPRLKSAIYDLIAVKRSGAERDSGPRIEPISAFIESELARWSDHAMPAAAQDHSTATLDALFRESLTAVWGRSGTVNNL